MRSTHLALIALVLAGIAFGQDSLRELATQLRTAQAVEAKAAAQAESAQTYALRYRTMADELATKARALRAEAAAAAEVTARTQARFNAAPGILDSGEVARVHRDVITRIRRVLERSGLNPRQLGLPPRPGEEGTDAGLDSSEHEQPLLDFGDARDGAFFPGLKSASVSSLVPFGPRAGLPLRRLRDPDLARAHQPSGWSGQRVSPPLARELERLLSPRGHGGSQGGA
jgi:hypothetical protein